MASAKFTSREREGMFRLIVLLNSSLQFIVLHLEEMATARVLSAAYLKELKGITEKVEKEINALIGPDGS